MFTRSLKKSWRAKALAVGLFSGLLALSSVGCTGIMARAEFDNHVVVEAQKSWPESVDVVHVAAVAELQAQGYRIREDTPNRIKTAKGPSGLNSNPGSYAFLEVNLTALDGGTAVEVVEHHLLKNDQGKSSTFEQRLGMMEYYILKRANPERAAKIEKDGEEKANAYLAEKGKPAEKFSVPDPGSSPKSFAEGQDPEANGSSGSTSSGTSSAGACMPEGSVLLAKGNNGSSRKCPDGSFTLIKVEVQGNQCAYQFSFSDPTIADVYVTAKADLSVEGQASVNRDGHIIMGSLDASAKAFLLFELDNQSNRQLACSWDLR
ncbi:MAG: hypothetical protein U0271_25390 [Polyangiaceae bacterium]